LKGGLSLDTYVDPKIQYERGKLDEFKELLESAKGRGQQERNYAGAVEEKERFLEELNQFRENIMEVVSMGYDPDLDDGVLINIAPLHRVVSWNDAEKTWRELLAGKYEWSTRETVLPCYAGGHPRNLMI